MSDAAMTRQEMEFSVSTEEFGKRNFLILDKLLVDDVFRFMVVKEIYRLMTGLNEGDAVPKEFRDALILDDYIVR